MKKIISCLLVLSLLLTPALAFRDISSAQISDAADTLNSLGIMNGVGSDLFSPNAVLTRGQFCKVAVTALGTKDVTAYKNYTIFPDVKSNNWAAGYVNAAVRKHGLVRGLPDGTFAPNKTITYGEICTIFLSMLGYKSEDVGSFWPSDYIAKAEALGIASGITPPASSSGITRGQAAVMLNNLLVTNTKDGDILLKTTYTNVLDDRVLLSTSETDADLDNGQVKVYNGTEDEIYSMADSIPGFLAGARGYLVFDNTQKSKVLAFIPEISSYDTFTVKKTYADRIETDQGVVKPSASTIVVNGGDKYIYSESWFDLLADSTIKVYYTAAGKIDVIAADGTADISGSFVYGISGTAVIPAGYSVVKNGVKTTVGAVKKYDVVTLDPVNQTAVVTDKKLSGALKDAYPAFQHPSRVTVMGKTFGIPEAAAASFSGFAYDDKITLLFDSHDNVVSAVSQSETKSQNAGVLTAYSGGSATIKLASGILLKDLPVRDSTDYTAYVGKAVTVYEDGAKFGISLDRTTTSLKDAMDFGRMVCGGEAISPKVILFDRADNSSPYVEVSLSDVEGRSIARSQVTRVFKDGNGSITAAFLENATTECYDYGVAFTDRIKDEEGTISAYRLTLRSPDGEKTYSTTTLPSAVARQPVAVAKGMENAEHTFALTVKKLASVGTVGREAFNGTSGVVTNDGYYALADTVMYYAPEQEKFVTAVQAKANYEKFTLYRDTALANGGKIRVIYLG